MIKITPSLFHFSLIKPLSVLSYHKRFYGNKSTPGHAHKILNALHKNKIPPSSSKIFDSKHPSTETLDSQLKAKSADAFKPTTIPYIPAHNLNNTLGSEKKYQPLKTDINEKTWLKDEDKFSTQQYGNGHNFSENITNYALQSIAIQPRVADVTQELLLETKEDTFMIGPKPLLPLLNKQRVNAQIIESKNQINDSNEMLKPSKIKLEMQKQKLADKLHALEERGLFNINESKLKGTFYKYYTPPFDTNNTLAITLSVDDYKKKSNIDLGLLKIHHIECTTLLTGIHSHINVIYITTGNHKIVWGYLTSEKKDNIFLSTEKAFKESTTDGQYLKTLQTPFIVSEKDLIPLDSKIKVEGYNYINKDYVKNKLDESFIKKVIPKLKNPVPNYVGIGVTESEIECAISKFDLDQIKKAEKYFCKYKEMLGNGFKDKIDSWLINIEKVDAFASKYLKELINKYNEK